VLETFSEASFMPAVTYCHLVHALNTDAYMSTCGAAMLL